MTQPTLSFTIGASNQSQSILESNGFIATKINQLINRNSFPIKSTEHQAQSSNINANYSDSVETINSNRLPVRLSGSTITIKGNDYY